jgi:ribosomal protein S27AE
MEGRETVCSAREKLGGQMICSRCGALLVEDRFMDWAARWRCLKCGQAHDSKDVQSHMVNERNRLFPPGSEPEYLEDEVYLGLESFLGHLPKVENPTQSKKEGQAHLFKRVG